MYAVRYAISQQETPTAPVPSLFDRGRARVTTQHLLRHELRDAAFLTNRRHSTPRSRPSFPILLKHRHGTDICRHPTSTCRSLVCQKRAVRTWTLSPATWVQFCNPGLDSLLRNHGPLPSLWPKLYLGNGLDSIHIRIPSCCGYINSLLCMGRLA